MEDKSRRDRSRLRRRYWGILLVGLFMVWLQVEDVETTNVLLLAGAANIWGITAFAVRHISSGGTKAFMLGGFFAGVFSPITALIFIVVKAGYHAHGYLDYSTRQLAAMMKYSFLYGLWGVALGFIWGILTLAYNKAEK